MPDIFSKLNYMSVMVFVFVAFTGATALNPVLPFVLVQHFNEDPPLYLYGLIVAAFPLGQFLSAYVLAIWAEQQDYQTIFRITSIAALPITFGCGLALWYGQFWLMIVLRFLNGCLEGNVVLARDLIIGTALNERDRNLNLGVLSAAITSGFIVGPLINGFIFSIAPIVALFFPFILSVVLLMLSFFMPAYRKEPKVAQSRPAENYHLLETMTIWFTCLSLYFAIDLFYQYIPLYLTIKFHLEVQEIAILLFGIAFSNAVVAVIAYWPHRILSYRTILITAAFCFLININLLTHAIGNTITWRLCLQGGVIAILSNNLIYFLTQQYQKNVYSQPFLMSHIVASRAIVSAGSGLLSGALAGHNLQAPLYISMTCVMIFIFALMSNLHGQ